MEQTDFGNIVHKNPSHIDKPKSIEELSLLLKKYNDANTKVTLKGSGNSMFGQSLTNGVQIDLSNLSYTNFNKNNMTVTAGGEQLVTIYGKQYNYQNILFLLL